MNKTLTFLLMTTAVLLMTASCKSPDDNVAGTIELSTHEVSIGAEGEEFTVDVTSSADFSIQISNSVSSWLSVDPDETTYSSGTLTFTAAPNNSTSARTGNVIFRCLDTRDTLVVTQAAGEDTFRATFLENTVPGLYGSGFESFQYTEYTSQYSVRNYTNSSVFDFKIMNLDPATYLYVKSVPTDPQQGASHSIGVQQNVTTSLNPNYYYSFTVEKVEGGMIWLYNQGNSFGIILTKE